MPQTPQWTEFPKYPVIVGVGLLATAVTLAWWAGADISPLFASGYIRRGQFWRLFTTIFPHLNILHLAFNLYWLWIFGTVVERIFGLPGLGKFFVTSALQRDYTVVMGMVIFFATLILVLNLLADMLYAVLDPRVRLA